MDSRGTEFVRSKSGSSSPAEPKETPTAAQRSPRRHPQQLRHEDATLKLLGVRWHQRSGVADSSLSLSSEGTMVTIDCDDRTQGSTWRGCTRRARKLISIRRARSVGHLAEDGAACMRVEEERLCSSGESSRLAHRCTSTWTVLRLQPARASTIEPTSRLSASHRTRASERAMMRRRCCRRPRHEEPLRL